MPCISDLLLSKDLIFKMPLQSDTMNDLIQSVGHCDLYFLWSHLYIILLCNHERQAPIRRALLSSDNSCSIKTL